MWGEGRRLVGKMIELFQHFWRALYLPVFGQISLFFSTKNLKYPGFENLRLTGLLLFKCLGTFLHNKNCHAFEYPERNA